MPPRMHEDELREELARRGLSDPRAATAALTATLHVLGERLVDDEAKALAAALPRDLAKLVEDVDYDADFDTEEMFERIRRRMHATPATAREHAEIVLTAIGHRLDPDRRTRIARALPERAADHLLDRCGRENVETPPHPSAKHAPRLHTLASGKPGSSHPVAESAPPAGHLHSVACNESPHEETKLSTARGPTQVRFHESLAEGRPPGPARPITDASD